MFFFARTKGKTQRSTFSFARAAVQETALKASGIARMYRFFVSFNFWFPRTRTHTHTQILKGSLMPGGENFWLRHCLLRRKILASLSLFPPPFLSTFFVLTCRLWYFRGCHPGLLFLLFFVSSSRTIVPCQPLGPSLFLLRI